MKLSIVMHTCRKNDAPHLPAPLLEMMVRSMEEQDYQGDYELIIVDLAWEHRKDYFANRKYRFPLLHIPDRSTPFRDRKLLRIASPKNTGIIYARGDCVVFTDDCQRLPTDGLSLLAEWAERGVGATMCYEKHRADKASNSYITTGVDQRGAHLGVAAGEGKPVPTRQIGFLGGTMSMVPIPTLLEVNGWDEMFDGSRQLEDGDMILRLTAAAQHMAYECRSRVIEYETGAYDERVVSTQPIKCNGAYAQFIWSKGRTKANTDEFRADAINHMCWENCVRIENDKCTPHLSPCTHLGDPALLHEVYSDPRLVFDLVELRRSASWEKAHEQLAP